MWQLQNHRSQWKSLYSNPEDTRRQSTSVALPNSSPIKRWDQKTVPTHEVSSDENEWHYCDAPLNFGTFDLKIITSFLNRMCKQTESLPLFFFRQIMVAFVFLRIVVSVSSLKQRAGPSTCWLVGAYIYIIWLAKQRLCQHLTWPGRTAVAVLQCMIPGAAYPVATNSRSGVFTTAVVSLETLLEGTSTYSWSIKFLVPVVALWHCGQVWDMGHKPAQILVWWDFADVSNIKKRIN